MAPRRGGGGGFSTSSGSGDSDSTPNVWTEKTELFGTDFHDRYIVAEVVIEAICLFALILIAIWSVTFRKRSESSRAVFRWFRFGAAMSMELVALGFSFISIILSEKSTVVAVVYYLIASIINSFTYLAEIFLLYTVYALLTQLNKRIAPQNFLAKPSLLWINSIFCAILVAIYIALLALRIQYIVEATLDGEFSLLYYTSSDSHYELLRARSRVLIAYNVLYMVFSIEVLALAIMTFIHSLRARAAKSKIDGIFLLALIACPLFVRSVIEAAFAAAYSLDSYLDLTPSGAVAETFFYWFCTVAAFAGLVLIGARLAKDVPETEPGMLAPQAPMIGGNMDHYGAANSPAGHMGWWDKQPQATQQQFPVQGGGQAPPYAELRDSRAAQPELGGQGVVGELSGHGDRHDARY